jgi:hypothetical protein
MPYDIIKTAKGKFSLINTATGEVHCKNSTKKRCKAQQALLEGIDPRKMEGSGVGASSHIPTGDMRTEMLEMIEKHAEQRIDLHGKGIHHHSHGEGLSDIIDYYLSSNSAIQPNAGQMTSEDIVLEEHPMLFNAFAGEEAKTRATKKRVARLKREKKITL